MDKLILASGSQIRQQILKNAGLEFEVITRPVDEAEIKASMQANGATISEIADSLAEAKARRVSSQHPGLVIGADQILDFGGQIFDKPVNMEDARARLIQMRGQRHQLVGGCVICDNGLPVWRNLSISTLTMRNFSDRFLDEYVAREGDAILSSVGAYRLEGPGIQLFSKIEGDYFAILGLDLLPILAFLRQRKAILS